MKKYQVWREDKLLHESEEFLSVYQLLKKSIKGADKLKVRSTANEIEEYKKVLFPEMDRDTYLTVKIVEDEE